MAKNSGETCMTLKDSLKRAEEQGRDATRRALDHAREHWEDTERRIRAGMRIHPRPKTVATTKSADPVLDQQMKKARAAAAQQGKPTVSVRGHDIKDVA
jgi:predicted ATPase